MNKDIIEGNWKQLKGKVRENWGKLTDDDLDEIAGRRDHFIGKVQEKYGTTKEDAMREWEKLTNS
ncbi:MULTISPECIES: CsbD family protein [Marinobacter]|uniref:CsbD family protein n=1 Tax=Marinobacter xiaoshiensis TaxID=3073652 RepID=A0ABU2HJB9_9GAMM|nr:MULTISPECIES: CsbD family protein [unclassified Marinobacter]MBK1873012.1 CsbD family protein [Marinobacter sp. 1-3A]MBK1886249.1 CsbD family protein [Marinobacter sp. DY40_1A1]MDS1311154.1 CsbD family protein [Marinobacter sp. F60267]